MQRSVTFWLSLVSLFFCSEVAFFKPVSFASGYRISLRSAKSDFSAIDRAIVSRDLEIFREVWERFLSGEVSDSKELVSRMVKTIELLLKSDSESVRHDLGYLNLGFMEASRGFASRRKLQVAVVEALRRKTLSALHVLFITERNLDLIKDFSEREYFLFTNTEIRGRLLFGAESKTYVSKYALSPHGKSQTESALILIDRLNQLKRYKPDLARLHVIDREISRVQFYLELYDNVFVSVENAYRNIDKLIEASEDRIAAVVESRRLMAPAVALIQAFINMGNSFRVEQATHLFTRFGWIPKRLLDEAFFSEDEVRFVELSSEQKPSISNFYKAIALRNAKVLFEMGLTLQAYCRIQIAGVTVDREFDSELNRKMSSEKINADPSACSKSSSDVDYAKKARNRPRQDYFSNDDSVLWDKGLEPVLKTVYIPSSSTSAPSSSSNSEFSENYTRILFRIMSRLVEPLPCFYYGGESHGGSNFFDLLEDMTTRGISSTVYCASGVGTTLYLLLAENHSAAVQFIAVNRENLARESAMRNGEFLSALCDILKIRTAARKELNQLLAKNYLFVFSDNDAGAILLRMLDVALPVLTSSQSSKKNQIPWESSRWPHPTETIVVAQR